MDYFKLYEDIMDLDTDINPQTKVADPKKDITIEIVGTGELTLKGINGESSIQHLVDSIINAIRADKSGDFNNWRGKIELDSKLQSRKTTPIMTLFPKFPEGLEFNLELGGTDNNAHTLSINSKDPNLEVLEAYRRVKKTLK